MSTCLLAVTFALAAMLEIAGVILTIHILRSDFSEAKDLVERGVQLQEPVVRKAELPAMALRDLVEDPTSYRARKAMERFVDAVNRAVSISVNNARRRDAATLKAVVDLLTREQRSRYLGPVMILAGVAIGTTANIAALYVLSPLELVEERGGVAARALAPITVEVPLVPPRPSVRRAPQLAQPRPAGTPARPTS